MSDLSARERHAIQTERAKSSQKTQEITEARKGKLELLSCIYRGDTIRHLDCGCGDNPKVQACGHPEASTKECIRFEESGARREAIRKSGAAICEICLLRVKKPDKFDSVKEWRGAFKLPEVIQVNSVG